MTRDHDQLARERAAFASMAEEVAISEHELDAGEIWSAVAGDLSREQTALWLDRAAESPEVAEAWRLAREMQAEAEGHQGDSDAEHRRWPRQLAWWAGIAATLLLAVGLWPGLWDGPAPEPPVYRALAGEALSSQVEEGVSLSRDQLLLRWSPAGSDGWRYDVRVTTDELVEVARGHDLSEAEFLVPVAALEALDARSRLYWRVEAKHEDGRRRASPTFFVSLE